MIEIIQQDEFDFKDDIFNDLKKDNKEKVSITLDKDLIKELEEYKTMNDIKELSPLINAMLKDWIKKKREKKK